MAFPVFRSQAPDDDSSSNEEALSDHMDFLKHASWRIEMLIAAGFDTYHAGRIAAIPNLDWRQAKRLKDRGCSQALVEEILR